VNIFISPEGRVTLTVPPDSEIRGFKPAG